MKKKIKDCTFKEFTGWANARACDGRWNMLDAMNSIQHNQYGIRGKAHFLQRQGQRGFMEKTQGSVFKRGGRDRD